MTNEPATLVVPTGDASLRIDALAPDLLRIRVVEDAARDESWAVAQAMRDARDPAAISRRDGSAAVLETRALTLCVEDATLRVDDPAGRPILASLTIEPREKGFALRIALAPSERVYALGDKTGPLDRRGGRFENWTTDKEVTETSDPIYKAIPFLVAAGGPASPWGLLVDASWRTVFDVGAGQHDVLAIESDGGAADVYLLVGAQVSEVVRRYGDLTGRPPLPPRWAFGYHQCRYSYMSADEVRQVAARLRSGGFPADVIWLDIGFQDRNRPFTSNPATYPDLPGLVAELKADGFATVVITDLHIAAAPGEGYAPCDSGLEQDVFLRDADGTLYAGEVWPGLTHFPDFSREKVRAWWGGLYRGFVEAGVAGFWVDMNEPAVFDGPGKTMPDDIVHCIETPGFAPRRASHAEMHNLTGLLNSQATFEGLETSRPGERPLVMTRSTFAGGQKWAVTWTGDNDATWADIELGVRQTLNLGLSGFAFTAVDVGGFMGTPSPDLLTRWFQVQAFMPLFRDHTAEGTPPQEPWVHGPAHEALRCRAVEERYRLMPTLYALAAAAHRTGAPMMRPVFFDDNRLLDPPPGTATTFLLGPDLLVAVPPPVGTVERFDVALPAGRWFDYWSGVEVVADRTTDLFGLVEETASLERLPVFVRAGAILARQGLVQTLSKTPTGPLELHVYVGADGAAVLYDDDGTSTAYARGVFRRQPVAYREEARGTALVFAEPAGSFEPPWSEIVLVMHGWDAATAMIETPAGPITATVDPVCRTASATIAAPTASAAFRMAR